MTDEKVVQRVDLVWGLDLTNPDVTTQGEIDEFRRVCAEQMKMKQIGLEFWLDTSPDVLKRYRAWADKLRVKRPADDSVNFLINGIQIIIRYAQYGFLDGITYSLVGCNFVLTPAQMLEMIALSFRYVGPAGMANIAEAAEDLTWQEPNETAVWPEGWKADPGAFRSGIDFSTPGLSADELRLIEAWYLRYLGEIPGHVAFLGRHRPEVLKAYRSRFENTLRVLPKEIEPYVQIQNSVERTYPQGIREGVLLARGFGLNKRDVLEAISWGTFYGTTPALDVVQECVGDLLDSWEDPS